MSSMLGSGLQVSTKSVRNSIKLFDNQALSDVQIKLRDGERIFGHKQILAQQSEWFFRAFNGNFPVASSKEICLDDEDDDPKAVRAMIRHIYDPEDTVYPSTTCPSFVPPEMMSQVNVFAAADKYDVPSLRVLVISVFTRSMEHKWQNNPQEFCAVIQRLCGPTAVRFADPSLQISAASFCSEHI
ncbi:hypothetical protein M436DRAFT_62257 [Aureobasidium namibiae CBS 147.97]|uniref:BTB domain-containing protein n=1 Tax=Aureobasidium namibiae CBS 147.97 TaxID=1043004 RepID=A0A074XJU3_9PEZI|nr:uncharacterized protein M436DRAFT_62257 [Aureobasidium namibiae CBS 147.97]KEQ74816.1 hypothetical protein M436DRAFT_62257 [Aureobasidium namibiae CBS 147.97]